jgi:hypothetical protein
MKNKIINFIKPHVLIILILAIGFLIRSIGREWDSGTYMHPDERFVAMVLNEIKMPETFENYFNPKESVFSPFNTNYTFYVYGGFPILLAKSTAIFLDTYFPQPLLHDNYGQYYQIGRTYNALFDIGTAFVIYLICIKFFSKKVALISAIFYSITVMVIQQSNFFTMDLIATFFMTLSVKLLLDVVYYKTVNRQIISAILSAIAIGLAVASKFSSLIILPFAFVILVVALAKEIFPLNKKTALIIISKYVLIGLLILIFSYIVFRVFQPFIFIDSNFFNIQFNEKFLEAFNYQYKLGNGDATAPFTIQWYNSIRFFTPLLNLSLWGIGLPIMLSALFGMYIRSKKLFSKTGLFNKKPKRREVVRFLLLIYIVYIFVYLGNGFIKYIRYFLPIVPFLIIFAADYICYLDSKKTKLYRNIAIIIIISAQIYTLSFLSIYFRQSTRIAASEWFFKNVPAGSTVGHEVWDDQVPFSAPKLVTVPYSIIEFDAYRDDNAEKFQYIFNFINKTEYIVLASNRQSGSVGELPKLFPMTSKYYKALFSGELGYTLVHKETSYPSLGFVSFNDEDAEESFYIYDHPSVWIFKKERSLSSQELSNLLN